MSKSFRKSWRVVSYTFQNGSALPAISAVAVAERKIVTPLRPTEYHLLETGDRISLTPSIGNLNHPYQSHYWIRDNTLVWDETMTPEHIRNNRMRDDALRESYFTKVAWPWWRKAASVLWTMLRKPFSHQRAAC